MVLEWKPIFTPEYVLCPAIKTKHVVKVQKHADKLLVWSPNGHLPNMQVLPY